MIIETRKVTNNKLSALMEISQVIPFNGLPVKGFYQLYRDGEAVASLEGPVVNPERCPINDWDQTGFMVVCSDGVEHYVGGDLVAAGSTIINRMWAR